ncbi:MAG TPA: DUF4097 family beta strand repeat-containing protein [Opitutaceae bacterium]|nr:DUF4097 family beta strand repeat-containing protein [Opitutaceae bacterium]
MKTRTLFLAAGLMAFVPFSAFAKIERVVEKTFTVQPGGTLKVETSGGGITVESGPGDTVKVMARETIRTDDEAEADTLLKDLTLTIEQQGNDVVAKAKYTSAPLGFHFGIWPPVQVSFVITVPTRYHADLHTSGGGIKVGDLTGNVLARTSGGGIRIGQIDGTLDAHTSGGEIRLDSCTGDTKLDTSGGGISAQRIMGKANLRTSGGSISVKQVENALQAHTSGGGVEAAIVGTVKDDCSLSTSGGSIRVAVDKTAAFRLDASTSGGGVHAAGLTIRLEEGGLGKSRLVGDVNGGGPLLKLRTSGGGIDIKLR